MPRKKDVSSSDSKTSIEVGDISDVSGTVNIAGGSILTNQITAGLRATEISQLFNHLYAEIEAYPNTSPADKEDLKAEVEEIQSIVTQASEDNRKLDESFLLRRFRNISRMAP